MFDVWRNVLAEVEQKIDHMAFATWFPGSKIVSNDDGDIKIGVTNVFKVKQFQTKFDSLIRAALEHNGVNIKNISYVVSNESSVVKKRPREITFDQIQAINAQQSSKEAGAKSTPSATSSSITTNSSSYATNFNSGLIPAYTLDNYVIGTNNNVAVSVAQNIIDNPGGRFNPFFLYGGPGLGKTHLVQAIGNALAKKYPNFKIKYSSTTDFFSEFVQSIRKKTSTGENQADLYIKMYRSLDVLILDDFQMVFGKQASQDAFFSVFNDLHSRGKQIIVTSDRLPNQIKTLDPRLSSRLVMTGPIDLQMPSFEDRCAILQIKAELMKREVENEVIEYVAEHVQTNIRELEGEFNKVLLYADIKGIRPIEVIHGGYINPSSRLNNSNVTAQTIISAVAESYDITVEQLCGKSRVAQIKTARQVAMYLLQEILGLSTTKTALEVGLKDHTTAMHGVKKIKADLTTDFDLREKVELIKRKIYE